MPVSVEDTARIAGLAHLGFSDEELTVLSGELSRILDWMSAITAEDVAGVEPLTTLAPTNVPPRTDIPMPGLPQDEVLVNAPDTEAGFIRTPRVL